MDKSVHSAEIDFRLLFESVPGLLLVLTPQLTIIAVSDAYLNATKTKRKEITGKYIFDIFTDNFNDNSGNCASNLKASLFKVLKNKEPDTVSKHKCKTGFSYSERYWNIFNKPIMNVHGEVAYIIHRVEDITELMHLEQKAVQQQQIEQQLQSDISQLENEILKRDKVVASSNAELEAFSYSISHDLRAPLRAIFGYSKILSDNYMDRLDEEANEMLDNVMKNVKKMGLLIDDLLAFARVGKKEMLKTTINMAHVVQKTLIELKHTASFERTKFNISPLPPAWGDYSMMGQVFTNLISNAIKYSQKTDEPIIEIGSFQKDGNDIYYVKDNGVGFEMKYYNKLFGVFQRLHSFNDFEGNGVGLALVKRIIIKHGGNIWAEAEPGHGATFYFFLPH